MWMSNNVYRNHNISENENYVINNNHMSSSDECEDEKNYDISREVY